MDNEQLKEELSAISNLLDDWMTRHGSNMGSGRWTIFDAFTKIKQLTKDL